MGISISLLLILFWGLDGLVMNLPFLGSFGAGLLAVVLGVLVILRKRARKQGTRLLLAMSLASILTVGLNIGTVRFNWWLGQRNAERIVEAVRAYQKDHGGAYPPRLQDLVPDYLGRVPRSRLGIMSGFRYSIYDGKPSLLWIKIPPFGRPGYDFVESRWWYVD